MNKNTSSPISYLVLGISWGLASVAFWWERDFTLSYSSILTGLAAISCFLIALVLMLKRATPKENHHK